MSKWFYALNGSLSFFYGGVEGPDEKKILICSNIYVICSDELAICPDELAIFLDELGCLQTNKIFVSDELGFAQTKKDFFGRRRIFSDE